MSSLTQINAIRDTAKLPTGNLFLDSLPLESGDDFFRELHLVELPLAKILARGGDPVPTIVFPIDSSISTVNVMADGTTIEVMFIGREGFYGTQVILGDTVSGYDTTVQLPGKALTMDPAAFVRIFESDAVVHKRALAYVQTLILSMSQFLGCNRLHMIEARCSRWLLMCHDRVAHDTVRVTHEFLAEMLGVRRAGVTVALQAIQLSGAIEQRRGAIVIKDRPILHGLSCECYARINTSMQRLLGYQIVKA